MNIQYLVEKISLPKLAQHERRLAMATLAVVGGGLLYVQVAEPLWLSWKESYAQMFEAEERLDRLESLSRQRDEIEADYRQVLGAVEENQSPESFSNDLLTSVESLGRRSGLIITGIKPLDPVDEDNILRFRVEVTAKGEGHQFIAFLQSLQEPENLIVAEKISLLVGRSAPRLTLTFLLGKVRVGEIT